MLTGKLSLHEIDDVERFVVAIVNRHQPGLNYDDHDDLIVHLVETCWELSLRYQPGGITFSTWSRATLQKRLVDWQRQRFGRTRWVFHDRVVERPPTELVSLDADDPDGPPLGETLGSRAGDPALGRSPDLARLLGKGSSTRARDFEALGLEPPRRTPG